MLRGTLCLAMLAATGVSAVTQVLMRIGPQSDTCDGTPLWFEFEEGQCTPLDPNEGLFKAILDAAGSELAPAGGEGNVIDALVSSGVKLSARLDLKDNALVLQLYGDFSGNCGDFIIYQAPPLVAREFADDTCSTLDLAPLLEQAAQLEKVEPLPQGTAINVSIGVERIGLPWSNPPPTINATEDFAGEETVVSDFRLGMGIGNTCSQELPDTFTHVNGACFEHTLPVADQKEVEGIDIPSVYTSVTCMGDSVRVHVSTDPGCDDVSRVGDLTFTISSTDVPAGGACVTNYIRVSTASGAYNNFAIIIPVHMSYGQCWNARTPAPTTILPTSTPAATTPPATATPAPTTILPTSIAAATTPPATATPAANSTPPAAATTSTTTLPSSNAAARAEGSSSTPHWAIALIVTGVVALVMAAAVVLLWSQRRRASGTYGQQVCAEYDLNEVLHGVQEADEPLQEAPGKSPHGSVPTAE
eukprot:TRINITY_DN5625_c0_g1_i3.p1 TRINITY_DN5625_c0_g1~~TRINITY_DN5625_c0_g1_i3.p1  ORF type:complete len:474 (+),score=52.61 TRINITY_DN5625_c0_g1_i3:81-1502(+)